MCTPALAIGLLATGLSAVGQVQSANAQASADKYNAQVASMNANIERKKSEDALRRGQLAEQQKRQEVAGIKGKQLAAMGANNVDTGFGSPLETIVDTATLGEIDALTVRTNAHREAYDNRVNAANYDAKSSMFKASAKSARTGGLLAAAGTLLGGAGDAWGKYSGSMGAAA